MLIVDGFAGGGGASTGIEWGSGHAPTIAINHDPEAIAMHAINHPSTRTVTTQDHHALVTATLDGEPDRSEQVAAFLTTYNGTAIGASLRAPLPTVTTHDRFALVTVAGLPHRITDIATRHLTPRELATAQGFPTDYVLDPEIDGKRLSRSAQVRMIGNAVCPDVAAAIVRANVGAGAARAA
jgi:DNA (cytosine-5)-methyltransferase 1